MLGWRTGHTARGRTAPAGLGDPVGREVRGCQVLPAILPLLAARLCRTLAYQMGLCEATAEKVVSENKHVAIQCSTDTAVIYKI